MSTRFQILVFLVPISMLVLALGQMPWAYYEILRLVITAASALIATIMFAKNSEAQGTFFVVVALAYNPFIPLRIGRGAWEIVNIATIVAFIVGFVICRSLAPSSRAG